MTFWMKKLPAHWKEIFEDLAKDSGDETRGNGARFVDRVLREYLKEKGLI